MRRRFYVAPCDNAGTTDGKRITWDVIDRQTGRSISDHDTRAQAREAAREQNAEIVIDDTRERPEGGA